MSGASPSLSLSLDAPSRTFEEPSIRPGPPAGAGYRVLSEYAPCTSSVGEEIGDQIVFMRYFGMYAYDAQGSIHGHG